MKLAADGLRRLSEFGAKHGINVIVENHGGLSSNGEWLAGVMKMVDHKNCGTLPDFGNFRVSDDEEYDRYKGVEGTDAVRQGRQRQEPRVRRRRATRSETDYVKMMKIVLDAGYHGYVGIEWEGDKPGEVEGVRLTKRLLERVRDKLGA